MDLELDTKRQPPIGTALHVGLNLNGHTALVTAATSGIGLATSTLLPQMGATVWLNGRSEERLSDAVGRIKASVPTADLGAVAADVATAAGVAHLPSVVEDVDILVNMAGGTDHHKPLENLTDDDGKASGTSTS